MSLILFSFGFVLGRCYISQKTGCITVTKADIAGVFSEIILFVNLITMTLVNTRNIFKNFPEFAGIAYRKYYC
jgi:uncharacterized membrane protein YagU involved in acid resistance